MALHAAASRVTARDGRRPGRPGTGRGQRLARYGTPYLLLAPFLMLFAAFMVAPLGYAFWLSLFVERRATGAEFSGLANYERALHDPSLLLGLVRVAVYALIQVPLTVGVALLLALLLDSKSVRGRRVFQLGFFLPVAIPAVISTLLWGYLYGPTFGLFTQIAQRLGVAPPELLSERTVLPSMANIAVWSAAGATMVILFAGLRSIPTELYEAAALDGAGGFAVIWHIKLPLLRSTLMFVTVLAMIAALQLFTEPSVLAANAPGVVAQDFSPNLYAYSLASATQQYNYAAAVAFVLAILIISATAVFLMLSRRRSRRA